MNAMEPQAPKRGGCLTAFIVIMLVLSPLFGIVSLIPTSAEFRQSLPNWPQWAILLMGLLALANFGFFIAIWKWKRWGVYGFIGVVVAFFVINLMRGGIGFYASLFGLALALGIFYRLVNPIWKEMR
jgi:hypothetical protein